jgi:hypothetical protein
LQGREYRSACYWLINSSNSVHGFLRVLEPEAVFLIVQGMAWLQSTLSNRFDRFRKECGHVFQGRYKTLLLDANARVAVGHCIHLIPGRVGLVAALTPTSRSCPEPVERVAVPNRDFLSFIDPVL